MRTNIVGKTVEGKFVFGGVFKLVDTYGLLLDMILEEFKQKGCVISWKDFYQDAKKAGWRKDIIIKKVRMDSTDSDLNERVVKYFEKQPEDERDKKIKSNIFNV